MLYPLSYVGPVALGDFAELSAWAPRYRERMRRRWVESGGVRLSVSEEGPADGTTVVLVHGYPDSSAVWDGVAAVLAERFHVVRYDVRGCGESGAPEGLDGYRIPVLVDDLAHVVRATSPDQPVHLVAHDWGSIQCWPAVSDPALTDLFASYTSISGPDLDHIGAWMRRRGGVRHLRRVLRQLLHSWYIGAFQFPVLPELVWRIRPLRTKFHATYRDARNGVQLYRANMRPRLSTPEPRRTSLPVQQIALTKDPYVTPPLLESADPWCDQLWRRELVAEHWAVRSEPAKVARLVTDFVDHVDGSAAPRELARARVGAERRALAGQLAMVTGAGSGIGRATALALGEQGVDVLCVDIDFAAAERTAADLVKPGLAFQLDVTDSAATQRLADHVLAEHGVPDLVMANAGIGVSGSFLDTSEADWRRVIDVNLWGVIHTLRAFVPPLVERGEGGHVVVTASAAGYVVLPTLTAYGTTKAAVLMLAQSLSSELARDGIGVSAICPGVVNTNIAGTTRFAGLDADAEREAQANAAALYERRGFGPEKVATEIVAAVLDKRVVVPVTPEAKIGALATRFAPATSRAIGRWIDTQSARHR